MRDWIVIAGTPINTGSGGGGYEFFGPYTEEEAKRIREQMKDVSPSDIFVISLQLIKYGDYHVGLSQNEEPER